MELNEDVTIPKDFIIKFSRDQQVKLEYLSETDGVYKYESSYDATECLKEGESIQLTISIEYSLIPNATTNSKTQTPLQ